MELYKETAKKREAKKQQELTERHERALQVAQAAARLLKDQFGATEVVLFGSLCHPQRFHHRSDIDLAVWGLPHRQYFCAVGQLQAIDAEFSIDLVEYALASSRLQKVIQSEGKQL